MKQYLDIYRACTSVPRTRQASPSRVRQVSDHVVHSVKVQPGAGGVRWVYNLYLRVQRPV